MDKGDGANPLGGPSSDHVESAIQKIGSTALPLQLATGRLGDTAGPEEDYRVHLEFMFLRHGAADCLRKLINYQGAQVTALHFMRNDEAFAAIDFDAKRCTAARLQGWVALFDRLLNVLRIIIAPADDKKIFDAASYK